MTTLLGCLRPTTLYWQELLRLKTLSCYVCGYRDRLARHVKLVSIVKAISSSAAIGAWVLWQQFPWVWSAIIVASQILDAVKDIFPFAKSHRSASEAALKLEVLLIESLMEWEKIYDGTYKGAQTTRARGHLLRARLEIEARYFPEGISVQPDLFELAQAESLAYFKEIYGDEVKDAPAESP